jgi:pectinesterase
VLPRFDKPFAGFVALAALCAISASAAEKADIIVAKDGSGTFTTIQAAINSVSSSNNKNVTILVKNGTYNEHLAIDKSFISLIGEDREKTIIQFSIEREQWSSTNGSTVGCAVINIGCTPAYKKTSSTVTDIVIGNLTVENTYNNDNVKTMVIKDEGNSNRIYVVHCNVWCKGHDTISLWTSATGMYYHADCSFRGSIDAVCPRGWCYAVACAFYETRSSAPLWHEVAAGSTQKFTVRTGTFMPAEGNTSNFKLMNSNNSSNLGTRFFVLDAVFSPKVNQVGTVTEAYFYHCQGGSNADLLKNTLSAYSGSLTQNKVTASWTFDNKWDPENAMPPVLPFAALPQPWNNAYDIPASVQLKWVKGRNAGQHALYFGASNPPPYVKTQTENSYEPPGLSEGTYYWRTDAIAGTDTVKGSVWSFTVGTKVPVIAQKSEIAAINAFSVTLTDNNVLTLRFALLRETVVSLQLFDLQGKPLVSLPKARRNAGMHTERLPLGGRGLSAGTYVARLNAGSIARIAEVTVQR